jgi:hypothetical protein
MDLKLKNTVVLVTGGSRGIGNPVLANFTRHHPSLTRTDRHIGRMERRAASPGISIDAAGSEVGATFPIVSTALQARSPARQLRWTAASRLQCSTDDGPPASPEPVHPRPRAS